ncbi:TonB-dependent hemoglobin/transferrin/lactoferrin family receptor [Thalassotalea fusca]
MFKPTPKVLACAVSAALLSIQSTAVFAAGDASSEDLARNMEVIVVSGSRTEKALKDVAGSISVVTEEDLEKQLVNDMNQLFKYDPSVQVTGSQGGAQNFIVRGMGGDRILMIKDGMRMNEGYGANGLNDIVGRGFIETDTLKQVEIAKGAASSLYGSDALGGIVVFTTKDASDYLLEGERFAAKVKAGYSDTGEQTNIGGTLALQTGGFEHLLNLTHREGNEQQNFHETKPTLDIESDSVMYKGKYNLNAMDFVSLTVDHWQQEVSGDSAYGLLEYFRGLPGYDIVSERSNSEQDNTSVQLRYYSETATPIYDILNVSVYSNRTKQIDVEYGLLDIDANFGFPIVEMRDMWKTSSFENNTVGFLSNASFELNSQHTLGYGLDIEKSEALRTEVKLYEVEGTPKLGYPQTSDKFPETDVFRAGLFINDEITLLNGDLTVTPGIRFDMYDMDANGALKADGEAYRDFDENHVSLNVGALYRLNQTMSLFAQYGQGFKVPAYDLAYIDHDNSIYGYKIVPSDDLSPEESDTYEIGLRGHQGDFYFNAAIYHTKFDNFLATQLIDTETSINRYTGQESQVLVYQYQNIDAVTIDGVEASVQYHLDNNISMFANAAYQDGKNDETNDYITSIAPLSGVAGVSYNGEQLSADIVLNWAKRMTKVNQGDAEIAGYGTLDFLASYEVSPDLRVNLAVTNLTDKEYVRYNNAAGHKIDADLAYLTEQGRAASVNVSYQF